MAMEVSTQLARHCTGTHHDGLVSLILLSCTGNGGAAMFTGNANTDKGGDGGNGGSAGDISATYAGGQGGTVMPDLAPPMGSPSNGQVRAALQCV